MVQARLKFPGRGLQTTFAAERTLEQFQTVMRAEDERGGRQDPRFQTTIGKNRHALTIMPCRPTRAAIDQMTISLYAK